jgi:HSP20 family protein
MAEVARTTAEREVAEHRHFIRPRCVVSEAKDGKVHVMVEMPGVRREDLDLRLENNSLLIRGRRDERAADHPTYLLRERRSGDYVQTFTLDETIDQSRIDADLENGILRLELDLKESVRPKAIPIRKG